MKKSLLLLVHLLPAVCLAETFSFVGVTDSLNVSGTNVTLGGANSYVRGLNCTDAPGTYSMAFGPGTSANGAYSGGFGYSTAVPGNHSFAFGYINSVSSNSGMALGSDLVVNSYRMVAVGSNNAYQASGTSLTAWQSTDLLFVVGNGPWGGTRSNALEIYKNGNLIGNGADNRLPFQTTLPDNSSILTRTLGDSRYFLNTAGQIALGSYHVADANAALLVGNGVSGSPVTSLKILKNGNVETKAATIGGTLNVTGSTTVAGLTAGSTTLASLGVSGVAGFSGSVSVTGGTSLTSLSASGNSTLGDSATDSTTIHGDLTVTDGQIVTGSWEVADANAAIIVGNGTDTNNRANSFVVKKNGVVEVESIEVKPNGVIRVPESGDISMGAYN